MNYLKQKFVSMNYCLDSESPTNGVSILFYELLLHVLTPLKIEICINELLFGLGVTDEWGVDTILATYHPGQTSQRCVLYRADGLLVIFLIPLPPKPTTSSDPPLGHCSTSLTFTRVRSSFLCRWSSYRDIFMIFSLWVFSS
jgi:hypothetical protein